VDTGFGQTSFQSSMRSISIKVMLEVNQLRL
jgi:hypothetical protein